MRQRPNPLPRLYRWRTNLLQTPLFGLVTAAFGSLALLVSVVDKKGNAQHRVRESGRVPWFGFPGPGSRWPARRIWANAP
jgi:hypothetical protein